MATISLFGALLIGGWKFFSQPWQVGALEFTPHTAYMDSQLIGTKGFAIGDIDSDGRQDIVTAGENGVWVFRNKGEFNFEWKIISGGRAVRAQVVDFNSDDKSDVLVSYSGDSPSVSWLRNNGDLEFTEYELGVTGNDAVAVAGDIDADGTVDIVTSGNESDAMVLRRWMNNGAGTFTGTTLDSDSGVSSVAVGDLDRDGYRDIITGGTGGLQRWDNNGSGIWERVDVDDSNENATHIVTGDPGTGGTWIVTADVSDRSVALYRSGPTASSESMYGRKSIDSGNEFVSVRAVDLDNDGDVDILTAVQDSDAVYWYENNGADFFTEHVIATELTGAFDMTTADFDGDGDLDIAAADRNRGAVYVYERLRVKPVAAKPSSVGQSTDGTGLVQFTTELSDSDRDETRIRVQYSVDGSHWYKPWITKVTTNHGSVDLKNSNGYQIGTSNAIDTDEFESVTLTMMWDSRSLENTGGPIVGDIGRVQLRIIPRDARDIGLATVSSAFRVDNEAPDGLSGLTVASIDEESAELTWNEADDSSDITYEIFYGTDQTSVLDRRSDSWSSAGGSEEESTPVPTASSYVLGTTDDGSGSGQSATISGLEADKLYTFKIFATDEFGNISGAPSVQAVAKTVSVEASPSPVVSVAVPSPTAFPSPSPSLVIVPASPSPVSSPSALPSLKPSIPVTTSDNRAPMADAGIDQVVNPKVLVVLQGGNSFDADPGDTALLHYSWKQISGPEVDLLSGDTAAASFSSGQENDVYIFTLTVRDPKGASSTDTVTVAVRSVPVASVLPVEEGPEDTGGTVEKVARIESALVKRVLWPADLILFIMSLLSTSVLLVERASQAWKEKRSTGKAGLTMRSAPSRQGKVVHHKTGQPLSGAVVQVFDGSGKLKRTEKTNAQGVFATFFPAGDYTLVVRMDGYSFAPAASKALAPPDGMIYTGGKISVKQENQPLAIVVPMKPTTEQISNLRVSSLHAWQAIQHWGRVLTWPLFLAGALLNSVLVFMSPGWLYLLVEVTYIGLILVKIGLELRMRPAYGQVRDAITHVPLDLSVVRLFDERSNRLIMTRVTNNQGKFFALPPSGTYTITVTKPGYATFTKKGVEIKSKHDTTMQMVADLMPVAPQRGGLQFAKAATI